MSDPIHYYGYNSRDTSPREEHEMLNGKQPIDVETAGIQLILDHQVSWLLWVDEELTVMGRKNQSNKSESG
jgi:hypothetical protein